MAEEKILVVDDDPDIREIITLYLQNEGYTVITAEDGTEGLSMAVSQTPDLIILDMMLPGLDGIEVCQEIRKQSSVPILFLSCKSSPHEKSLGLIAGGDDYMGKPFEPLELIARVKAHLRRNRILDQSNNQNNTVLAFHGLTIDSNNHTAEINGKTVLFTPKEFKLLALLARNPGTVFNNEQLYEALWNMPSFGDHRTILVHISNIRKKLEENSKKPLYIKTVKGVGYKFSPEEN